MENKKKRPEIKSERRVIFSSRTFNSKLFLKLTGDFIHPSIICVQILKYEKENRKIGEIERALPWLKTFSDFMNFINIKETPESSYKLLIELTWLLFYKYYKKNLIFKKAAEQGEFFYILLQGKMLKLTMVFKRDYLTLEEYLIYLFKMKLTREKEILKRCRELNKFYADIDGENLIKFCKENPQFNYDKLKERAIKEINELGFKPEDFQENKKKKFIYNIDKYLKISNVKKDAKNINNILATPKLYIGSYEKVGIITKGMMIGKLTPELIIDDNTYITIDNCDVVSVDKKTSKMNNIYELISQKKKRALAEYKNNFYIFRKVTENCFLKEIIPNFEYKLYHNGDKIFVQDSFNEGIYLIMKGKINLSINTSLMEISSYILNIKNSLKDFKDYVSNFKIFQEPFPSESETLKSNILKNLNLEEKNQLYITNKYDILTINEFSIFGTNELYDYKTGLYYFTAECITKEAIIYFLPKKYFYALLKKEYPAYIATAETVESKAKFIIEKMKNIIQKYERKKLKNNNININLNDDNENNKEENKNKIKNMNIFNNYRNSIKNLRNFINIQDGKLFNKGDEKTCEFPILLKEKEIFGKKIFNKGFNEYNNVRSKTLKEKLINNSYKKNYTKTLDNIQGYHYINRNINKRNKTLEEKSFMNKTRISFKRNIKLKLPSNFPFNVKDKFPTIIKHKNYNFKYIFTEKKV